MKRIPAWFAGLRDTEPARWAELARALLVITVGAGWLTVDEETVNWIVTGVGMGASVLLTRWVRSSVYSQRTVDRMRIHRTPRRMPTPVDLAPPLRPEPPLPEPPPGPPQA